MTKQELETYNKLRKQFEESGSDFGEAVIKHLYPDVYEELASDEKGFICYINHARMGNTLHFKTKKVLESDNKVIITEIWFPDTILTVDSLNLNDLKFEDTKEGEHHHFSCEGEIDVFEYDIIVSEKE